MPEKHIHRPEYEGPDRRSNSGRRPEDIIASNLKLAATVIGILILVLTMGIAWGTAKAALDGKVDRSEFVEKNAVQDKRSELIERRAERLEAVIIEQIAPTLRRLDERVSAMYCDDKPPGCK